MPREVVRIRPKVPIRVERFPCAGMAEHLLYDLHGASAGDECTGEVVAKVVVAKGGRKTGACRGLPPHRTEAIPPNGPPVEIGDEKAISGRRP